MSWKTTLRREADVLTLAGLGPCGGAGAAGAPPSPLGPSALTCPVPTGPLELALWPFTSEGGRQTSHAATPPWATSTRPGPPGSLTPLPPRRSRSVGRARRFCSPRWSGTRGRTAPAGPSPSPCATCTGGCGLIPPPPCRVGHAQLLHRVEVLVQELVMAGLVHLVLPETTLLNGRAVVLDAGGEHERERRQFSCGARAQTISADVGVTAGASSPPTRAAATP